MEAPSLDLWLREAKSDGNSDKCGMYLFHNGVVRASARARVRLGDLTAAPVSGMDFSYDKEKTAVAINETRSMEGIYYVRVWMNSGMLSVGDSIMLVLVGGDTRPHVAAALDHLVSELKENCVTETEII